MSVNYSNTFSLDTTDGSLSGGNQDDVDVHNVPNGKTVYIAIAPGTYSDFAASWQIEFNYGEITKSSSFTFEAGKIYDLGNTSSW